MSLLCPKTIFWFFCQEYDYFGIVLHTAQISVDHFMVVKTF